MPNVSWHSPSAVSEFNRRLESALREASAFALQAHPEVLGVWLFGSRARGVPGPRSDVDLLLVATRAAERMTDRPLDYADLLDRIPAPVDLLVVTPAELSERAGEPFYARLAREAVRLAGRDQCPDLGALISAEPDGTAEHVPQD